MKLPTLREIPMSEALAAMKRPGVGITMRHGQWDNLLACAYDAGWILMEVVNERPVRAYRKEN